MVTRFQAASLVASPFYPSAVAWSDENLVAVASGHLVTIVNPAIPLGPRGLITIPLSEPFPIGVVEKKDLLSDSLLPTCLSREIRHCIRSISWSHIGVAPNCGCLLAVCTTNGRVKLYRLPFCEFSAEWVEVMDISEMLYSYYTSISFGEIQIPCSDRQESLLHEEHGYADDLPISALRNKCKRRKQNTLAVINKDPGTLGDQSVSTRNDSYANAGSTPPPDKYITLSKRLAVFPCSVLQEGSSVEVLTVDGHQRLWVSGKLSRLEGEKALVKFLEKDRNGKRDRWVQMNPGYNNISGPDFVNDTVADHENHFPKIRPSMKVGNLPKEIVLGKGHGMEEILKVGQAVEAWIYDGWVEGVFMGFNESGLLMKLDGDTGTMAIDASSVRLAPVWVNEQKSWQVTLVNIQMKGQDTSKVVELRSANTGENNLHQIVLASHSKVKPPKKIPEECGLPLITVDQYASRSAMLFSLVVAWSPILRLTSEIGLSCRNNLPDCCSLLAVGGKSGKISFWKIHEPQCYSVTQSRDPTAGSLVGLLQAHNTWITAIGWALFVPDAPNPQLLLAAGSCDGSVKIWLGNSEVLLQSSEVNDAPFSLLKEIITVDSVLVSVISLIVPVQSPHKMLLAVGKGSGSFEVWICDISASTFDRVGSYDAHDHIVTGLAWAFDGRCLYSCSQDNSVRSWIIHGSSLSEVPIPSNTCGVESSADVPNVFDSCFGLAVSPGNLVLAVARSFDADLLNPMYQARTQKAAVEFFWIGGQQLDMSCNRCPEFDAEAFPGFPEKELVYWEHNLLWSLNQFENLDKPLVVWDIIAALLAFKQVSPKFVEHIVFKWLNSYTGSHNALSTPEILSDASRFFPKITSRKLHLLNIINRNVVLTKTKEDKLNSEHQNLEGSCAAEEELTVWMELLQSSERELRERLVAFTFSAVLSIEFHSLTKNCKLGFWHPVGLAQMQRWFELNYDRAKDHLELLQSEVGKLDKSKLDTICEYVTEERCSYCSASVPFEYPDIAFCQGVQCNAGVGQSHKHARCVVSMQICPATPIWFCGCCQRWTSKLAPQTLFTMPGYPSDLKPSTKSSTFEVLAKPLCLFCGILLQRLQPEFLLSATPV